LRILWAPWRMKYILSAQEDKECIFCKAVKGNDRENWVVYRGSHTIAMLNIFPYNTGHVMVAPKRHVPRLELLNDNELLDLAKAVKLLVEAIDAEYKPHGYNIGMNIGRVAGAGIEAHIHIHIVPRWSGDTNFMPVIGETKVMPESLNDTYNRIRSSVAKIRSKH